MAIEGVDYSYSRPGGKALKAAGKHFAVRYITPPGVGNKGLSQAEYNDLHAYGIEVPVVYETDAGAMKRGKVQGIADAKAAEANLLKIKGLPNRLPIYFACDWDAAPSEQAAINAYLDGAAEVLGRERVGLYAGYWPLSRAKAAGKAKWWWQTYAWSGGNIEGGIQLYQYKNGQNINGAVDLTKALTTEYGQHDVLDPAAAAEAAAAAKAAAEKAAAAKAAAEKAAAEAAALTSEQKAVAAGNAKLGEYPGMYFFKAPGNDNIYVYNPLTGTKRHILSAEWSIIKAFKHNVVALLTQAEVDKIQTAS